MSPFRPSLFLVVVTCVTAIPRAATAQWVAYNDFAWLAPPATYFSFGDQGTFERDPDYRMTPGSTSSKLDRVTLFTDGNDVAFVDSAFFYMPDPAVEPPVNDVEQARSGFLRNYETGETLPVHVTVDHTGETFTWAKQQGAGVAEVPGSPAYAEFWDQETGQPIIGLWGTADGNDINSTHTVTLSNLDPDKFYEYVTFGNFGHWRAERNGVLWRWTTIEGHDPDGFQNLSTVDTDYATAVNIETDDPEDPRRSVGHEQRSVIRSESDPSHYVTASGEIWFDGWVTKFHFKPGEDGTVDIVTRGILNAESMEFVNVEEVEGSNFSTDMSGVPVWKVLPKLVEYENPEGDPVLHPAISRHVDNLINADITDPEDPEFGANYANGWIPHSDPAMWPADPDVLEATVGTTVTPPNWGPTGAHWYLAGFKLSELPDPVGLPGDYNGNNVVDAADYTVWRDHLGQTFELPNRDPSNSGPINEDDYSFWVDNFGATLGAGTGGLTGSTNSAVPEPGSFMLGAIGYVIAGFCRRRQGGW